MTLFTIFALRGRDCDNPSLRGRSSENYEQRMELIRGGADLHDSLGAEGQFRSEYKSGRYTGKRIRQHRAGFLSIVEGFSFTKAEREEQRCPSKPMLAGLCFNVPLKSARFRPPPIIPKSYSKPLA